MDVVIDLIIFIGGSAATLITIYVRGVVSKTRIENRVKSLEEFNHVHDRTNKAQDAEIRMNRENILETRASMLSLRERFDDFQEMHRAEMKEIQTTQKELTKSVVSLDATLKGLAGWLERVEKKL